MVKKEAYAVPLLLALKDLIHHTPPDQGPPGLQFLPAEGPIPEESPREFLEAPTAVPEHIGIFPGSFNPLTLAHVELIRQAQERFCLEEMILVLDSRAMDKEIFGASLEDRLVMLRLFARAFPHYRIALSSHGRFLDKLQALRQRYPFASVSFYFIVGYDTLVRILDPKYYVDREAALRELFQGSYFLVANRADPASPQPPSSPAGHHCEAPRPAQDELAGGRAEIEALLDRKENQAFRDRIAFLPLSSFYASISSTMVRERVARGEEISGLVPPEIHGFIEETKLYAPPVAVVQSGRPTRIDRYGLRLQLLDRLYQKAGPEDLPEFQADLKELLGLVLQDPHILE
ncbi:MAG: nicotinate-nicotinamide nucleotide adenylyltransferase [Candidatus Tectomicrobia bacterium]|uniref:nicotinate-nucleotide adenylyltransferase n=1 Tax=Tectimicrobiota bacterium TaxID=2528274 RepID=A0A932CMM9_UNCTE|nr:nicotinate-nicotinamide nucleotide adenylyltransferase [Candidatus Tectomicrobia bacterium]